METASVPTQKAKPDAVTGARNGLAGRLSHLVLPAALAGLTIYFGFEAGGYFADTTGWVAAGIALMLALGALLARQLPPGAGLPLGVAGGTLALLAIWTLASGAWSDAPARALVEFDRVLLYLLVLLLFGSAAAPEATLKRLPAAFALAAVVLCGAGLFARTLPEVWPFALPAANDRMDFPVSYENALGALASLGFVFSIHVASWRREHALVRMLAAASLPLLAAALVLTFSRGGIAAGVIGALAYAVFGRSRGVLGTVLAAAPFVALAVDAAYDADLLASSRLRTAAAVEQGEDLALVILAASLGAGLLRGVLLPLERWVPRVTLSRRGRWILALLLVPAVALPAVIVGSDRWRDLYNRVGGSGSSEGPTLTRERLTPSATNVRGQSRDEYWNVAIDAFREEPLRGTGVGTFPKLWARDRPLSERGNLVAEGHSVYVETLAELGVVGGLLLAATLGLLLWPFVAGRRGRHRRLYAGILAATVVWLVHAGLDWDWELPVLTLWLFAAGGCALAARSGRESGPAGRSLRPIARVAVAGAFVLAALTPATVALSQARLDKSFSAFERGDCASADRWARSAISVLSARPESHAILSYCASRRGDHRTAVARMRLAVDRDPGNWEYVYGLALVRAGAGLDPRGAAREALRLNPSDNVTNSAVEEFDTDDPRVWRRRAASARLPLHSPQLGGARP